MNGKKQLKRAIQFLIIVSFILVAGVLVWILNATKPVAEERVEEDKKPVVEFLPVRKGDVQIRITTQGLVQPKKRTQMSAEISGKVVWLNDKFVVGGKFAANEELLRIETANYDTALIQAKSQLVEAEVLLSNERARASQARRDWSRLGRGQPSELALRVPQIKSAEARIVAANASIAKAELDITKAVIRVPFNATVARKNTEVGNFLAIGSPIGEFFQTDPLEIRLPLPLDEMRFVNTGPGGEILGNLSLFTKLGGEKMVWDAEITRTEGQIDQSSRSLYIISDIDPRSQSGNPVQLQPGLFLDATITGKTFSDVAAVPTNAFLDLNQVVLINAKDQLEFREVEVLRREGDVVYVNGGLNENERLCLTELSTMIEGTQVEPLPVTRKMSK